jgi:diguanylate cyclase (GGDEF)-like protein
MLNAAGVPEDTRWRSLLLYFREMKDYTHFSDVQKADIQALLTHLLERKDFSDERLREVLEEYKNIATEPYRSKVDALFQETSSAMSGFRELLSSRYGNVTELENISVAAAETESDPAALVRTLRSAFHRVKSLLENDINSLERLASHDGLTNLANRRAFDAFLAQGVEKWLAEKTPLSLALFDIDHFKRFNDGYGHRIGDQALQVVAKFLLSLEKTMAAENNALASRYGGEEFALVVSGPDARRMAETAEKIRLAVRQFNFLIRDAAGNVVESAIHITLSAGVCSCWPGWAGNHTENLLDSADKALYAAKQAGRDRAMRFFPEEGSCRPVSSGAPDKKRG